MKIFLFILALLGSISSKAEEPSDLALSKIGTASSCRNVISNNPDAEVLTFDRRLLNADGHFYGHEEGRISAYHSLVQQINLMGDTPYLDMVCLDHQEPGRASVITIRSHPTTDRKIVVENIYAY